MAVAFAPDVHKPPVRSVRLRVIGAVIELRADVPATRADCPTQRPCPHIHCEAHLWLVAGIDRPGRRHHANENRISTIRLDVIQSWPVPPSCWFDVMEKSQREGWSVTQMAKAIGIRASGFRFLFSKASRKLRENGVALREFIDASAPTHARIKP